MLLEYVESAVCARRSEGSEGAREGGVCCCGGQLSEGGLCERECVGGCAVLGWNLGNGEGGLL